MKPLHLLLLWRLALPCCAGNLQPGDTFSAAGCDVEVLGCYWDNNMGKGEDKKVVREFPYNVPGCYDCTPAQGGCLKAPNPPPCDAGVMSNEYCALACIHYSPRLPGVGSSFYAASQAGYACFCGSDADAQKAASIDKKVAWAQCNAECGCPSGQNNAYCGGKGFSARGKAGETCGGPWLNSVLRISCPVPWGWPFLAIFVLGSCAYVGGGIVGPVRENKGLSPRQMLRVHPHYGRWCELAALCMDGAHYARAPGRGRNLAATAEGSSAEGRERRGTSSSAVSTASKKSGKSSRSSKSGRKKGQSKSKHKNPGEEQPSAIQQELLGAPAAGLSGTAAGGGGRWVHVPT